MSSRYSYAKCSAKQNNKIFKLSKKEYSQIASKNCYYCDKPSQGLGTGLDRIDNCKKIGYVKENILPCCWQCNKIRGDILSVEETKVAIEAVLKLRNNK